MARKGENIYLRKDGRWEGRYIEGRKENKKPKYGSVYGKTYKETRNKLIKKKAEYAQIDNVSILFYGTYEEWLVYWLEEEIKQKQKESTYSSYHNKIKKHVYPTLGSKRMSIIKKTDIQKWIDLLEENGLAGSTIRNIYHIVNNSFKSAIGKGLLYQNPCANIKLPERKVKQIMALNLKEQKTLEHIAMTSEGNEAIIIALYTGLRIGEISALKWEDIDFDKGLIYVKHTLQRITNFKTGKRTKIIVDIPKTTTSCRVIPVVGQFKDILLKWRRSAHSDYVVNCRGNFAEPRVISYRFKTALIGTELSQITFHWLRHTFATRCIERNIDIVTLSRLLGHASVKMTLDVYADSTMEQKKDAMKRMDMLLTL